MIYDLAPIAEAALQIVSDHKLLLERSIAISPDAVHVLIGTILHLLVAAVLRTSVACWPPLLVVVAAQLANELIDFHHEAWPEAGMQLGESIKDCLLTLVLPTILMLSARCGAGLFARSQSKTAGRD